MFGFQYAVLGQLMTFVGTIYLSRRLKPNMDWMTFCRWLIEPLYSSLLLMVVACCFHAIIIYIKTNTGIQIATMIIFYIVAIFSIPRIEASYFDGIYRLKTLAKSLSLVFAKLGITEKLVFRLMGIKSL
ncbi:MAG UNVERIFIED_CONTAM: hypothetical protein LVR29_00165 [Microcystis novacekii LVE1205-3]